MRILKDFVRFIRNGVSVFLDASAGQYRQNSDSISEIREEIMNGSTRADDKKNLMEDRKHVEHDVYVALANVY